MGRRLEVTIINIETGSVAEHYDAVDTDIVLQLLEMYGYKQAEQVPYGHHELSLKYASTIVDTQVISSVTSHLS